MFDAEEWLEQGDDLAKRAYEKWKKANLEESPTPQEPEKTSEEKEHVRIKLGHYRAMTEQVQAQGSLGGLVDRLIHLWHDHDPRTTQVKGNLTIERQDVPRCSICKVKSVHLVHYARLSLCPTCDTQHLGAVK